MLYDDLVTRDNAFSPEMRKKTLGAFEVSLNLGIGPKTRRRMLGTRYHYDDAYSVVLERGTFKPRIHQAELNGEPVLMSREELDEIRRDLGPATFASQMMLDPQASNSVNFKPEWWRTWNGKVAPANRYILVDPANEKKKKSDYTTVWVIDLCADQNYYIRAGLRDKLNLAERIALLMNWHKAWNDTPGRVKAVAYEKYGKDSDIQSIEMEQNRQGYRFPITAVGGPISKPERIAKLIPLFEQGRIWFPVVDMQPSLSEGTTIDMINVFRQYEFLSWPYSPHDDMLDALARITDPDLNAMFPKPVPTDGYGRREPRRSRRSVWAA